MLFDTEHRANGGRRSARNLAGIAFLVTLLSLAATESSFAVTHVVTVENFRFDADDNNDTQIDTLSITAGDTVEWQWVEGFHTITSGLSSDPGDNPGDLFDEPSDPDNTLFQLAFEQEGDVPYFCRPHEGLNMKGVIRVQGGVGIEDDEGTGAGLPAAFALDQNFPNPFNPVTAITFQIARSEGEITTHDVSLDVYDIRGRKVKTLVDGFYPAGRYEIVWDGLNDGGAPVSSGIYLYRLSVDDQSSMRKMVLTK